MYDKTPSESNKESVFVVTKSKVDHLRNFVTNLESVAVAFSGGADSTLLLAICLDVLGTDRVLAVTADSPTLPRSELRETVAIAKDLGAAHVTIATDEMRDENFASNPPDRCFFCKQALFGQIRALAEREGYTHLVYGATAADLGDHRPGMRAAQEAGALAPLLDAGFTKDDVRSLSRQLGLSTWDKPAMACLSSRFPYGTRLTEKSLLQVEQAEEMLRHELGLADVRVRHHDSIARVEVQPRDFARVMEEATRLRVVSGLKNLGYTYVTLDLAGFRSGSMNETLEHSSAQISPR